MKKRSLLVATVALVLLLLLPAQAIAQLCFRASPFGDVIVLTTLVVGPHIFIGGEDVGVCGTGTSHNFTGMAHFRGDGSVHFAIHVISPVGAPTATCAPVWYQGTLNPPAFNSGSGFHRNAFDTVTAITYVPAACPAIPQGPQDAAGDGAGGGTARP